MKPYPKYKNSGVEWLGRVPEGWEVVPIKVPFCIVGGATPKSDNPNFWDGDIHWITPADLSNLPERFVRETGRRITELGLNSCGTTLVAAGAIALSTRAPIGSIAITKVDASTNQGCRLLAIKKSGLAEFFYYVLLSTREQLNLLGRGSTFLELSGDQLGAFRVPLPPLPEQQAIAAFLDRETAKIDGLIAEQRRLIALLAEKRQATISHAVTRGLNPNARLKPSGVEWLGDIPEGWKVVRLRRILERIEQGFSPECFAFPAQEGEWGVLKAGCVNRGIYAESENKALPPDVTARPEAEVKANDVLMSRASGSPELIGSVAIVRETQGKILLSDKIFRLNFTKAADPSFLTWSMASTGIRVQIINSISGGEGMANNLPQSEIKNFWIALPPISEQRSIAEHIGKQIIQLDALAETATRAIDLLQERRAALISAAVTGKIDIRDMAPAEPEAA